MNIINYILSQQAEIPLLAAFVLGLLVAVNPCQLAINMSALTYLIRKEKYRHTTKIYVLYALGKTLTYILLAWILMCLIGGGRNIEGIEYLLSKAELAVPYVLIAIGLFLIYRALYPHHHHQGENCHHSGQMIHRNGPLGSLLLGMTLAFAFCPESVVFYFGLLIPLSATTSAGFFLPIAFGFSAALPVLMLGWTLRKAIHEMESLSNTFEHAQQWINGVSGILFIIMAIAIIQS